MYDQCMEVGPKYCIQVKYEDLVLHPRPTLKKILEFADLEWTENVMEHQKHMEHISLSAVEKSTDQVIKEMITKTRGPNVTFEMLQFNVFAIGQLLHSNV